MYPNPLTADDAGEYVVIEFPTAKTGNWTLSDGETTVSLSRVNLAGPCALTAELGVTANRTEYPVATLPTALELSNGGETLTLRHKRNVVDTVTYENAPPSERWERTDVGWTWEPLGATNRPVVSVGPVPVTTFLPDAPNATLDAIQTADSRILLAGYTFSSSRVADALVAANDSGIAVRILLDCDPVGGMTTQQAATLDRLTAAGISVKLVGGPRARYSFHHAKYVVVDDRAIVLTENWKPAGVGGNASRGWGVVVANATLADELAATFRADAEWRDTTAWERARSTREFVSIPPANGSYPRRFRPQSLSAESVELLVTPDNAEPRLVEHLDAAEESILVEQVTIGGRDHALLEATLRAAHRGVSVRILLSGAWYAREENEALATALNDRARREGLPLEVRVAEPRGRFEKIHAKGIIVDGDTVVLGSLNWNDHALRENREVVVVLHGDAIGDYFTSVFDADCRGGSWWVSMGVLGAVALSALAAGVVGKKVRFVVSRG
ncbi:phosphatidylserine/phosphatidylglycerophosphate/cardiolipin synthase family protein [Haladaptatus sp. DYSN1]|uniref:phospholipase D-like domain-containing protein n=1 Tax=unclassified Haladaptatus TaxID=2622732 RepID=UPI00240503D5|nr:phospholipase D-like domain-containing protein [Haladaptatus sp. DYSN1]